MVGQCYVCDFDIARVSDNIPLQQLGGLWDQMLKGALTGGEQVDQQ